MLNKLIISRRSLKTRRNYLLKRDRKPRMMGEEGKHVDSFFSQLSQVVTNTKVELFSFHDFIVLMAMNDLRTFKPNKAKLSHELNLLRDRRLSKVAN